jgi:hypothetical protein
MAIDSNKSKVLAGEAWLFYGVALLLTFPLFTLHFFPSVDGAAHVYNAGIINGLVKGNEIYSSVYEFNSVIEPNWLGHAVMCALRIVFSPLIAEKILIAFCMIALPVSFRQLVIHINPAGRYATYLIFPFVYSFMLITGFYNFCLGLPLFFWSILYWLRIKDSLNALRAVKLIGLMGLTAGLVLLFEAREKGFRAFIRRALLLLAACIPALMLVLNFIVHHRSTEPGTHLPNEVLRSWIFNMAPTMTYDYEHFTSYGYTLAMMLLGLPLVAILFRLIKRAAFTSSDIWLLVSVIMLAFYFLLPDSSAGGGFISIRLCYYFFLFLALWICMNPLPRWIQAASGTVAVAAALLFLFSFYTQLEDEEEEAREYFSLNEHIDDGSVVLPLNYSLNWRCSHYSNYLSYAKRLIILENYEASSRLFPVVWKNGNEPYLLAGAITSMPPCADIEGYGTHTGRAIDYIIQWKYSAPGDPCSAGIENTIRANYHVIFHSESGNAVLMKRNDH